MDPTLITTQVTASAVIVWLLQRLKQSKYFPFITAESAKLNRYLAVCASALAAAGIHFNFNHDAGTLVISGLLLSNLLHFAGAWLRSFVFQEIIYQAAVKNGDGTAPKPSQATIPANMTRV